MLTACCPSLSVLELPVFKVRSAMGAVLLGLREPEMPSPPQPGDPDDVPQAS